MKNDIFPNFRSDTKYSIFNKLAKSIEWKENLKVAELCLPGSDGSKPRQFDRLTASALSTTLRQHFGKLSAGLSVGLNTSLREPSIPSLLYNQQTTAHFK